MGVLSKLFEPFGNILVSGAPSKVEHNHSSRGPFVVGMGDGSVSLLSRRVPNLRLDARLFDSDSFGSKLNSDSCLGLMRELILFEA